MKNFIESLLASGCSRAIDCPSAPTKHYRGFELGCTVRLPQERILMVEPFCDFNGSEQRCYFVPVEVSYSDGSHEHAKLYLGTLCSKALDINTGKVCQSSGTVADLIFSIGDWDKFFTVAAGKTIYLNAIREVESRGFGDGSIRVRKVYDWNFA